MKKIIFFLLLPILSLGQGIPAVNRDREKPFLDIPVDPGGSGRYIYTMNCGSQNVSVIDTNSDTEITRIGLASGKAFCMIFYRSVNQSVYVLGTSYYVRIDANEGSGTFNTKLDSGATIETAPQNISYVAWPMDLLASGGGNRWYNFSKLFVSETIKDWHYYEKNIDRGQLTFGHSPGRNVRLHPRSKLLENSYNNGPIATRFARILHSSKDVQASGPFTLVENYFASDLAQTMCASYVFGDFILTNTGGSVYVQLKNYNLSPIINTFSGGNASGINFLEYAPNAKIIFWGWKNALGASTTVHSMTSGGSSYTNLGTISRAAYKDTNETATNDIMYCPFNGKIYVQGSSNANNTGVTKIHVYDPTLAFASMYLHSITVGEQMSAERAGNYSINTMCMNRTRYWEAPDVTY